MGFSRKNFFEKFLQKLCKFFLKRLVKVGKSLVVRILNNKNFSYLIIPQYEQENYFLINYSSDFELFVYH